MLKGSGELVVKPLNEGDNASRNLEDLSRSDGRQLLVVLPLFCVLDYDDIFVTLEDL